MRRIFRPRVLVGTLAGLIALYSLVGFLLLPYLIKSYVIPTVSEQIKHPIVLREAAFNPFALSLRLNGLEVLAQNETPILGFEELFVNLRAATLFLQKVAFDEIRIAMPFVRAKMNAEGKMNLMSLVPPPTEPVPQSTPSSGEPKKMMPVEIDLLEIEEGILEYRDESKSRPVLIDVVPFHVLLRNFNTVRSQESESAYAFTAELGKGEKIDWEGTFSLEPVESDGKVNLSGIKLRTFYQAVSDQFQFDIPQGVFGLSASYHFDLRGQSPQATVTNGKVSIQNLAIVERGGIDPVVNIPNLGVEGFQLDLQKQTIDIGKVHSSDARVEASMDASGTINFQPLFTPVGGGGSATERPAAAETEQVKPAKPWAITVDEVALRNYGIAFEDRTLGRPGHVDVDAMSVTVKDIQIPFNKTFPLDLSFKLNETGSINVKGKMGVKPLTADMELSLEHVKIHPFQPYLDRFLNADVLDGAIDLNGTVHFAKEHTNDPMLQFQGKLAVNQLVVADRKDFTDVLTWKALNVNQIALDVEPTAVKIGEIVWQEPSAHIVVDSKGQLNLSRLAVSSPPADRTAVPKDEKSPAKASDPVPVTIGQVKLIKLAARFQDLSVEPNVRTSLTEFGGTIKGLSSKQLKKADVRLKRKVGRVAPLKIVGKINPLSEDAFTDLIVTLGAMDLTQAGSYSDKYVGYGLSKGKLSLDLKYKVSQKVLEAENLVHVDQLTFGEKTNSSDATSLPVPLIVGLLKDRKGLIEIDMPIRGNLNDPDFKYGKVVISTLLNLLGKVVASPFALMGKLVPGGGSAEDLQFIGFQPGSASLADSELAKLEALEKALDERTGLRLDIKGTTDSTLDTPVLQTMKLRDQLFAMSGAKPDQQELSPKEEQRLVEKLYAKLPLPDPSVTQAEPTQPTVAEMKRQVAAAIQISQTELDVLGHQRAEAIRRHLLEGGKLTEERIALHDAGAAEAGHEMVRTQLSLSAGL